MFERTILVNRVLVRGSNVGEESFCRPEPVSRAASTAAPGAFERPVPVPHMFFQFVLASEVVNILDAGLKGTLITSFTMFRFYVAVQIPLFAKGILVGTLPLRTNQRIGVYVFNMFCKQFGCLEAPIGLAVRPFAARPGI